MPEETITTTLSREVLDITLANMFSNAEYHQSYIFYAHLIGQCKIVLKPMPAPAAVSFQLDHYNLYINPKLFDAYTLKERLFILQHEMHHILNGHVKRLEDRNPRMFNYATDCAINQLSNAEHRPQGSIIPETFPSKTRVPDNLSAEQYYMYLNEEDFPPEDPEFGHDEWENSSGDPELQNDITKNMLEKAIAQTSKSRGDLPSDIEHYLALVTRKCELDWKKVLRSITGNKKVTSRKTILRKDRRNPEFEHIKGRTKDRKFDLLVIGDESGSVSDEALLIGINESLGICKITKTPLWYVAVDTSPSEPKLLKENIKKFTRTRAGGTYLSPAIEKAKEQNIPFKAVVVVTDGELSSADVQNFEKLRLPVIWLIEPTGSIMSEMNSTYMKAFKLRQSRK